MVSHNLKDIHDECVSVPGGTCSFSVVVTKCGIKRAGGEGISCRTDGKHTCKRCRKAEKSEGEK